MTENISHAIKGPGKWEDKGGYRIRWIIKREEGLGLGMLEVYVLPHGVHHEKTVTDMRRVYHVTNGLVVFTISGVEQNVQQGDTIVLSKGDVYSYKALGLAATMKEVCVL